MRFFRVLREGDADGLRELLDANVQMVGDEDGKTPQWSGGIIGAEEVARVLASTILRNARIRLTLELHAVNGRQPAPSSLPVTCKPRISRCPLLFMPVATKESTLPSRTPLRTVKTRMSAANQVNSPASVREQCKTPFTTRSGANISSRISEGTEFSSARYLEN